MTDLKKILQSEKTMRFLAFCGLIFVFLIVVVVLIVLAAIRPGYNSLTQYGSELGESGAPNSEITSIIFFICGVLLIAFSLALYKGIQKAKGSWIGPLLVAIFGIFDSIGSAIFPCDPGCVGQTFTGMMHLVVSLIGMSAMALAPFFVRRSLKNDERWQGYQTFSLIIGILALVMIGVFIVSSATEILIGLTQRIMFSLYLIWIFVFAVKLLQLHKQLDS